MSFSQVGCRLRGNMDPLSRVPSVPDRAQYHVGPLACAQWPWWMISLPNCCISLAHLVLWCLGVWKWRFCCLSALGWCIFVLLNLAILEKAHFCLIQTTYLWTMLLRSKRSELAYHFFPPNYSGVFYPILLYILPLFKNILIHFLLFSRSYLFSFH